MRLRDSWVRPSELAARAAIRWHGKPVPTREQVMAWASMSRAAAYRLIALLRDVRGEPPATLR